jgi:hypothetical protein
LPRETYCRAGRLAGGRATRGCIVHPDAARERGLHRVAHETHLDAGAPVVAAHRVAHASEADVALGVDGAQHDTYSHAQW